MAQRDKKLDKKIFNFCKFVIAMSPSNSYILALNHNCHEQLLLYLRGKSDTLIPILYSK